MRAEVKKLRAPLLRLRPGLETLLQRGDSIFISRRPRMTVHPLHEEASHRYYTLLHKYSFRLFLREVIKHQEHFTLADVTRYASPR